MQHAREATLGHEGETEELQEIVRLDHLQTDMFRGQLLARSKMRSQIESTIP